MPVKKYTIQDGIFVHEGTTASIKDTPIKEFGEGLKRSLEESGPRNTTAYILERLEKYARARLEAPTIERKKGQRLNSFQKELEANERQKRDCKDLLQEIDFLKKISGNKDTDQDFLMARFYYLGVLAQQADIRPVETRFFTGKKIHEKSPLGGKAKADYNKELLQKKYEQWQGDAEKVKKEKPSYKKWHIAGDLAERYANDPELQATQDTISRKIKI